MTDYIPTPVITSESKFFATEGNEFQITCRAEFPGSVPYLVKFEHNGKVLDSTDYMTISDTIHENGNRHKSRVDLVVQEANKLRDEGDYKCIVMDYHNNTNSASEAMTFVTEPFVELNPTNSVITIDKGKKQAQFLIEYKGFPPATFYVFSPKNEQISCDLDVMNRVKYDVVNDGKSVKFKVKSPDINDFGNYTLIATTAGFNFSTILRLVVSGKC